MNNRWNRFLKDSAVLREMLWKYRGQVGLGLLALIVVDGLEIVPALLVQRVIDALASGSDFEQVKLILWIFAGVTVLQALCRYAWRIYLVRASFSAGFDIRGRFAEFLMFLSMGFFSRKKVGDLMSLATNDTEAIRMSLGGGLVILADAVFYFLTIPVAMYWMSPKLTLLAFATFPIIPFLVLRQEREIHRRFKKVQESLSELSAMAQETISGVRIIKAFSREDAVRERFERLGHRFVRRSRYLGRVQSVFGPDLDFLMSFGLILLLYFGGKDIMEGTVTLGTFAAFQKFIQRMAWPMEAVGLSIAFYQRAVVGGQRLEKVYREKNETPDPATPRSDLPGIRKAQGYLRVSNLNFSFDAKSPNLLHQIDFEVPRGGTLGILGPIGAGKTTLLTLIPRLYQPPPGTIFLDGIDVCDWPLFRLRSQIAYVPQEGFLFTDTVAENIALGLRSFENLDGEIPEDRLLQAARSASVHEEILTLSKGYSTRLGERGLNVSGGQRQRITIARALIQESPVLILDDPLSAVDFATEENILKSLRGPNLRQTTLVAAHRISTLSWTDEILVFDAGRILQRGSHSELLKQRSGFYFKCYEQQRLQAELDVFQKDLEAKQ